MKQTLTMRKANLQKSKFSTLFFVLLTILSLQSKAQLFTEDFIYSPAGDTMTKHGWFQIYAGVPSNVCKLSNSGLNYQGYSNAIIGLGAKLNGSQAIYRTFANRIASSTQRNVYASFLVNISSVSVDSNHFLTSFLQNDTVTPTIQRIRGGLWVKSNGLGGINFGVSKARKSATLSNNSIPYSSISYSLNTTYLVVIKYKFNAGDSTDNVSLWINPSTIGTNEDPNPIISNHTDNGESDLDGINGFVLLQKANEFGTTSAVVGLDATIDAIKIDTVWSNLLTNNPYYFYKGAGRVDSLVNWGINSDGTGTHPINFTNDSTIYYLSNTADATLTAPWNVSGNNSKIIITQNTNFNILGAGRIGNSKIDVQTNASITTDTLYNQNWGDVAGKIILKNVSDLTISGNVTLPTLNNAEFVLSVGNVNIPTGRTLTVAGKLEIVHPNIILGVGGFILEGTGTLKISSPEGIALNTSGAVQTSIRTFDSAANYTYNGTGTNLVVGDALPNNLTGTLSIELPNPTDVLSLSRNISSQVSASGCTLSLNSGRLNLGSFDIMANSIINGSANSYVLTEGTGSIIRYIKPTSISRKSFYIGNSTEYRKIGITFPNGGCGQLSKFTVRYITGDPGQNGYPNGVTSHYLAGYWSVKVDDSIPTNKFTVEVEAFNILPNLANARILKRVSSSAPWSFASDSARFGINGTQIADSLVSPPTSIGTTMEFTVASSSAVLPIRLIQLTAKKGTSSVDLNWKVTNETALSLYQVERSSNGKEFSSIGKISSSNASSNVARAFTDNKPMADNFYRLKLVDQNGSYQYSQTLRVSYDVKSTILLYPTLLNKGMFTLQMSNQPKGDYKIDITNTNGQKIQHLSVVHNGDNGNQLVTLSKKYEPGMYIVVVTSPTGNKYTNRIIIQ